ncbi:uncharacterized protein ASPGLDRAFT_1038245 [Aspergillus glaucus CBS 516.65]|uniref:Uncharacterized protein n=1 Tax=Aspergillus glaucus CBS 516.65 TaxID=1160497 RepID=A0A1L9V6C9_ASPGL|nr:hypothetical protein ASPGLDRAFT_1038245 [Aspergillus glaucus CBS 516.65]OJJ79480.1 hypothetical protein ASPGLDRAFT_1038245 [Aspergillus glaucus CBS 516.65]
MCVCPYMRGLFITPLRTIAANINLSNKAIIIWQFDKRRLDARFNFYPANAFFASSICANRPSWAAIATKIRRLSSRNTGANVSSKSSSDCSFPLATSLALNCSIRPSGPSFTSNTHLVDEMVPSAFFRDMTLQVPKLIKVLSSLWIASFHFEPYIRSFTASLYDFGMRIPAFSRTAHAFSATSYSLSICNSSAATANLAN